MGNTASVRNNEAVMAYSSTPSRGGARALCRAALALTLAWAQVLPAWAAPAQEPLLGRSASPVTPNLVLTFDDSGSMTWNFMPDSAFSGMFKMHPVEPDKDTSYDYIGTIATRENDWRSAANRSSSYNVIYYNPEITYLTWTNADGSTMPASNPSAARLHPTQDRGVANLVGIQRLDGKFCYGGSTRTGGVSCQNRLNESFAPATYYEKIEGPLDRASSYRRIRIADYATFSRGPGRTDCTPSGAGTTCTQAQEYQNFANWYTYNRTRFALAVTAITSAMSTQSETLRLGYGAINVVGTTVDGVTTDTMVRGIRPFAAADRVAFYDWLRQMVPWGDTKLRRAQGDVGEYYRRADNAGPWGHVPGTNDSKAHLACRKSYQVLMTDGFSDINPPSNSHARTNVDGATGPLITSPSGKSYQYQPVPPYADEATGTLADAAMFYWNHDLRPDLPNIVATDDDNPAFWQHMSTFTIGLGVNGTLNNPQDMAALKLGTLSWPSMVGAATPQSVDDLWHAAVNGRGRYLSAKNVTELRDTLASILKQITRSTMAGVGVALSGRTLDSDNLKFRPSYISGAWSGELTAFKVDTNGETGAGVWKASEKIPAAASRNLFVGTGGRGPAANEFKWNVLTADQKTALGQSGIAADEALVNYLRGDSTNEGQVYRKRTSRLGDIVNSAPAYVKGGVDMRYHLFLPTGTAGKDSYAAFVARKAARPGVVYAGANDGMLHAFSETDGTELFGFIPRSVVDRLAVLSKPGYEHLYFVDGPLTEADAYLSNGWANILMGSTGAGGRSIFALDVTDPTALGAKSVLWEFSAANDSKMGHVLAPIEVGRLKNGQWAAVFGNGYDSADQRASLFVVNISTGEVIKRIDVGTTSGGDNGLGGVRLLRDGQQTIIAAYAGDLQGNVWKFDLSATSANQWAASFGGQPLYQTTRADGSAQPVTAPPTLVSHPRGGNMVLVGTGKLFEEGDQIDTSEQSLYGLWDRQRLIEKSADVWSFSDEGPITSASQIKASTVGGGDADLLTITSPKLDWSTDRGWSIAIKQARGQRQTIASQLITGLALFETIVPNNSDLESQCDTPKAAYGYSVLVDPINGGQSMKPVIDTNRDGVVNEQDTSVGSWKKADWTGQSIAFTEPRPTVCTGPNCVPAVRSKICPPGTVRNNLQSLAASGANVCVGVPAPSRWWWRQVSVPN